MNPQMSPRRKTAGNLMLMTVGFLFLNLSVGVAAVQAQQIQVAAANPSSAAQGTVNLNVKVTGKGFKKGAVSKFFVTGTIDPGGVRVNSTTFVNSGELTANVTVADTAIIANFDIAVANPDGRGGKGTELFAVTPRDPVIAYVASTSTSDTLMAMNVDGTFKQTVLAAQNSVSMESGFHNANWSPDGTQLVFSSDIQGPGIYVVNLDGTGLRKVISTNKVAGISPVWSPIPLADGFYRIAFSDTLPDRQDADLFLVKLDGTGLVDLTNTIGPGEFSPTWDPFATRLACSVTPDLAATLPPNIVVYYVGLVNGAMEITSQVNLTDSGPLKDAQNYRPDWAKTQDKLAVVGFAPGQQTFDIWVIDLRTPDFPINLTNTSTVGENQPSWSPDDSKIAFRRPNAQNKTSIFVMNADGTRVTEIGKPQSESQHMPDWRRNR